MRVNGQHVVPAFHRPGLLNYLPQEQLLPPSLSLRQAARLLRVDLAQATARFPGLRAQLHCRVGELSGGSARLLQTLLLLHADTAFSLFDEPFSGVMPVPVESLADRICAFVAQVCTIKPFISHTDSRIKRALYQT